MSRPVEIYQPMPDNLIRVHAGDEDKKLEVLADYKNEDHFSVRLTNSEACLPASKLETSHDVNWIRLRNGQVLRAVRYGEVRQLILSNISNGREAQAGRIGVILEEVLDKVIELLKANTR